MGTRTRNRHIFKWILQGAAILTFLAIFVTVILQKYSDQLNDLALELSDDFDSSRQNTKPPSILLGDRALPLAEDVDSSRQQTKPPSILFDDLCMTKISCPKDHFSFSIFSGVANVVEPRICLDDILVLGTSIKNAGSGINIVVINGRTGEVVKAGHFNMYDNDVQNLTDVLKTIEQGSAVLMASYEDPATKLNDEVKKLIGELGSTAIQSLDFRDNWVFAGGKGAEMSFEKHLKYDVLNSSWPEMIEMEGCIPQYQDRHTDLSRSKKK